MARKTLRDQLRESAKSATSVGAEHRVIVRELDANAASSRTPAGVIHLPTSQKSLPAVESQTENRTGQVDRINGQDKRTSGQDKRTGQTDKWTGQTDKWTGQVDRTNGQDKRTGQTDRTNGQDEQPEQVDRTNGQDERTGQTDRMSGQDEALPLFLPDRSAPRTSAQKVVLEYFERHGSHIANYDVITAETSIPYRTVRRGIDKLVSLGWLEKQPWYQGSSRGLKFEFSPPTGQDKRTGQTDRISGQDKRTGQTDRTNGQDKRTGQTDRMPPPYKEKIDREDLSISLSAERIAMTWPNLTRTGFGREQLDQITAALAELGKPTDKIVQSLDHAEWELERGQMLDKDDQPVADPCSWVFTALARTGYYRRPKGYVSPEEQAAKDAEAEAKAVVAARQAAEQAQFEAWRDGLSPDEMSDALRGHPGGPKDAWLKKIWRDSRN